MTPSFSFIVGVMLLMFLFFICFNSIGCGGLKGQYTVFGEVVDGMQYVDTIKRGEPGSGTVTDPDKMLKVYVQ